jgi:hypothetical protein
MTDHREVMRQALEALIWEAGSEPALYATQTHQAIESLRAALDEKVEPVAWQFYQDGKWTTGMDVNNHRACTEAAGIPTRNLYAHPPAPPASPDEDVKVVRLTREKYEAMCYLIDEIPALHIRMALLALLGDWPAQEGP